MDYELWIMNYELGLVLDRYKKNRVTKRLLLCFIFIL